MKRLQFKRVNRVLEEMLDTCIISEGMIDRKHPHIIKWGFYPNGRMNKQLVVFNRKHGTYRLAEVTDRGIDFLDMDSIGYKIRDLRQMIAETYADMI